MLKGNKGEWSEIYVFLKLLAEGKLSAADSNLNAIPNLYFPIIKILRTEQSIKREYLLNGNIRIIDGDNNLELLSLPIEKFVLLSQKLFDELKKAQGTGLSFSEIDSFLQSIDVKTLTASKKEKADINLVVHDLNTGQNPQLGFSIKSFLGDQSTLFNASRQTNFIFQVVGQEKERIDINEINSIQGSSKVLDRVSKIKERGFSLKFERIHSETLQLNLELIDSCLPKILAEIVLMKYSRAQNASMSVLLEQLNARNPLNYNLSLGHPFYEYKLKNFLTDIALGMIPSDTWTGIYNATGGIIIVKENGDIVCYHIYNRSEFQDYLLRNTRLETASSTKHDFGRLYIEDDRLFFKLNLQIRFD